MVNQEETWKYTKWKWMVLGAVGCMNNADLEINK